MKNEENTPIQNLHEHILSLAQKYPKKMALVACDQEGAIIEEITYGQLAKNIEAAASYLRGLGLKKGDRVALAFKNSPALLILSWAAWATGIVTVPMDTKRDTSESYQYKLNLNNVRVLIAQGGVLKDIEGKYLKGIEVVDFIGFPAFAEASAGRPDAGNAAVEWEESLSHPALVLFTSGTTGHPKGAKLSLLNLIVNADGIRQWLKIRGVDTFLVNLPLHHINSTTFCLSTLLAGGTIAVPPNYSNSHFWQQMAKTKATITQTAYDSGSVSPETIPFWSIFLCTISIPRPSASRPCSRAAPSLSRPIIPIRTFGNRWPRPKQRSLR